MYQSLLALLVSSAAQAAQPGALKPVAAPLRGLPWGQLNFLHTTDSHGWLAGHLQEPSFSADWGDYISLAEHLRARADADRSDVLLIDTGDRVEGNGLHDASEPKGLYINDILKQQSIDLICSGNHELYKSNTSENEYSQTVPNFRDSYVSSNIKITNPATGQLEPLAPRYRKFVTKNQGIRTLAFGFLLDFHMNANNTVVEDVETVVLEDWFQHAIRDPDLDLIVVIGHVAVRSLEYDLIFETIRFVQPDIPIQFFGGHTHIRDYGIYDHMSVGLESGRYLETVGFMSISGLSTKDHATPDRPLTFSRRYIDNNLLSFHHHSGKNASSFGTANGQKTTDLIAKARTALHLDERIGCSPTNLWVSRRPFPHAESIFSWLQELVFPRTVADPRRQAIPRIVICNTGAIRFDIFKGSFTRDSTFLVSPFTSGFAYVPSVPRELAESVLPLLNSNLPSVSSQDLSRASAMKAVCPQRRSQHLTGRPEHSNQAVLGLDHLSPGYTTTDDAGDDGDDTVHSTVQYFDVPNCFQSVIGYSQSSTENQPATVDLVFNEFIAPWILLSLQYLGMKPADISIATYMKGQTMTSIIESWVSENWACPDRRTE